MAENDNAPKARTVDLGNGNKIEIPETEVDSRLRDSINQRAALRETEVNLNQRQQAVSWMEDQVRAVEGRPEHARVMEEVARRARLGLPVSGMLEGLERGTGIEDDGVTPTVVTVQNSPDFQRLAAEVQELRQERAADRSAAEKERIKAGIQSAVTERTEINTKSEVEVELGERLTAAVMHANPELEATDAAGVAAGMLKRFKQENAQVEHDHRLTSHATAPLHPGTTTPKFTLPPDEMEAHRKDWADDPLRALKKGRVADAAKKFLAQAVQRERQLPA